MPSLVGDTTNKGYSDTGWYGNDYQSYYQRMLDQQRSAQQAAQKQAESNYARYKAYAEQQYKDAMANWQAEQNRQQSLWYKLTQVPAREVTPGWGDAVGNWWQQQQAAQNNGNLVGRGKQGMWSNFSGINQWTGQPYQNYGNLPLEAQYQFGLPTTRQDYINSMEQFRQRTFPLVMGDKQVKKPGLTEDQLEILREQRRGYQVGMPGIDGFVPPQVLGNNNQPVNDNSGGWSYPQFQYPNYGGGGWNYSPSQSASQWYNSMVQWNIGNK